MRTRYGTRSFVILLVWVVLAGACVLVEWLVPGQLPLPSGVSVFRFGVVAFGALALGRLASFGSVFSLFGGMVIGWSLQAPVSGFAAWILVSIKRPFRPGDRIQFPKLELTGDVLDVGAMYTALDQVGGSIGSEEAVGRTILVPNAMLFDEVVVRITYDSNWDTAEKILIGAAREITGDIIAETGVQPYIRSDLYDYGVHLQLRYQTHVNGRAEIAYRIQKHIFEEIQRDPTVDIESIHTQPVKSIAVHGLPEPVIVRPWRGDASGRE